MNTNFLNSLTNFLKKRTFEFVGLVLISLGIALTISFATYSPSDPSLIYGESNSNIKNFFGIYGSKVSDFLLQSFGDVIHELISVLYYLRVFMCQMIMKICTGVHRLCSTFSYSNIRKCIVIQC